MLFMLAASAGIVFFMCAFAGRLPKNVTVNGISVGGKSYADAARLIRDGIEEELKSKTLTVHGRSRDYVYAYPELTYRDNLGSLLKSAERGGCYTAEVKYYLNGLDEITRYICEGEGQPLVEPYAEFKSEGEAFEYFEGSDGIKADRVRLLNDIRASLGGGFGDVTLSTSSRPRTRTLESVREDTRLLSTFVTHFDGSNAARVHNIRLAASHINGTIIVGGGEFSFNGTVGSRTVARGFRKAKIIENGEFVDGVGGGVCQVSTTLYNAALLSGCSITELHPHSLAVSYVPPSYDAMVSGSYYDLKFKNTTRKNIYIRAYVGANYIKFNIYGRGDGARYGYSSVVTGSIAAPEETTSDSSLVKEGRDGTVSEGYLTVTRNGTVKTTLFRRDKYAPVKRVVLTGEDKPVTP